MNEPPPLDPRKRYWINENDERHGPECFKYLLDLQRNDNITPIHRFAEHPDGPWLLVHEAPFLAFLAAASDGWFWLKSGFVDNIQEGPTKGRTLIQQLEAKIIGPQTLISHQVYTQREWTYFCDSQLGLIWQRDQQRRQRGMR